MNTILGELGKNPKFIELVNKIESEKSPIAISGLNDVGMIQILSAIQEFTKKPICLLTYNEIQARKLYKDLSYFIEKVDLFNKKEIVTYDYVSESKDIQSERIEILNKIKEGKNKILVTTIEAVMQKLPDADVLYKDKLKIKIGETYNLEELKHKLVKLRI